MITNRTNWTPSQILELTLGQLSVYVRMWAEESNGNNEEHSGAGSFLFDDIGAFNEAAGIERIKKAV